MEEREVKNENNTDRTVIYHESSVSVAEASDDSEKNPIITAEVIDIRDPNGDNATLRVADFAKVEKSLASLGFFTPSSRRVKNQQVKRIGFTREIDGKRVEVTAEIIPSAMFGLPITADQDKYLALQKIITNTIRSEGTLTNPIRFKSAELLRLLNDSTKSGKNYKEVGEWLDVMSSTTIFSNGAVYVAGQKRFAKDRFRVFERAVSVGKEMEDGTVADANYVWLSAWQLENINQNFLLPIDLETYRDLKNHISKALVPLLQIWLYASHKAGSFEKKYDELCEILTLQCYRAPSQILRQLRPSLDELTKHEYIEKWRIEKTADRKAYKIIFYHGAKFHRDRRKRLDQKNRVEATTIIAESEPIEPILPEPGKIEPIAPLPQKIEVLENQTPIYSNQPAGAGTLPKVPAELVDALATRGLMPSAAIRLMEALPASQLAMVEDFIDYWDDLKKTKDVGEGLLYELIRKGEPLPPNFETRQRRTERLSAEARRERLRILRNSLTEQYEEYCRAAIDRFIAEELSTEEFELQVAEQKAEDAGKEGSWNGAARPEVADQIARRAVRARIRQMISLLSFEDFKKMELPALLSKLSLDSEPTVEQPAAPPAASQVASS